MEIEPAFAPSDRARQGDLIARSRLEDRHPFDRFGVVVTADCDMERARPEHQITFLRVVSVSEYVNHVWCRKKLSSLLTKLRNDTAGLLNRVSLAADPNRLPISSERLAEWLKASSPADVCAELGPIDQADLNRLQDKLARLSTALEIANIDDTKSALEALIALRCQETNVEGGDALQAIMKQAKNELAGENDELFFVSRLVSTEENDGYYVLLDNIGTITRGHIFDYQSEADAVLDGAHRFGRLEKTFKYAVVQRFAFLFQRIGLPDDRIDWHKDALQRLG